MDGIAPMGSRCIVAALFVTSVLGAVCAHAQRPGESLDEIIEVLRDADEAAVVALLRACKLVERDPAAAARLSVDDALFLLARADRAYSSRGPSGEDVLRESLPAIADAIARSHEQGIEVLVRALRPDDGVINLLVGDRLDAEPPERILTLIESPWAAVEVLVGGLFQLGGILPYPSDGQPLDAATEARAVAAVGRLLRHRSPLVRRQAVFASERPPFTNPPHLKALVALLESDPDPGVRAAILGILWTLRPDMADTVDLAIVVEALSSSDDELQCAALEFLQRQDLDRLQREVPHLRGLLLRVMWSDNGWVVNCAIDAFWMVRGGRADISFISALRQALHHPLCYLRRNAAGALGALGGEAISAVGDLVSRARLDHDQSVRDACVIALRRIDLASAIRLFPSVSPRLSAAYGRALRAGEVDRIIEGMSAEDVEVRLGAIRLVLHIWESTNGFDAQIARCAPIVDGLIRFERSPDVRAALQGLARVLHASKQE